MKSINCNKQAEFYFMSEKDSWTGSDFPDLCPPGNSFELKFTFPNKIQVSGIIRPYPLAGIPVIGIFKAEEVIKGQRIDNLTAPLDGWYVLGNITIQNHRLQAYYFCDTAGVIHNEHLEGQGAGMVLRLNPNSEFSNDQGFHDFATMIVHVFCLAISQSRPNEKSSMEKKIIHVTLSSGDRRISYVEDIDAQLYFKMKALFQDAAKSDGLDFFDNTWLKLTKLGEDSYICTLYLKTGEGLCPILTSAGSRVMDLELWAALHDNCIIPVVTDRNKPPRYPFIADKIEVPHPNAIQIFHWTGDFTKCLGWMMLFPDDIAKRTVLGR